MEISFADITEATAPAADYRELEQIAAELHATPRDLVSLAEMTATPVRGDRGQSLPPDEAVRAFIAGLILGKRLVDTPPIRPLSTALNAVYAIGHQRVIATHCDLIGIADAAAPFRPADAAADDTGTADMLFELGLAVSLALRIEDV